MSPSLPRIVLSLAIAWPCVVGGIGGAAEAQRAPSSKAAAAKGAPAGNETDRVLDGAAKALEAGNADAAMTALDGVLSGGGLSNTHMARALYLRGLAHRKKGRPAQAMADLTSAIWLKDGLSEKDRNAALNARSEVAREAGVTAPATGGNGAPAAPAAASASSPATTPAAAPRTRTAAGQPPMGDALSEAGFARGFSTPAPAPEPQVRSTPAGTATSSWESTTTVGAGERRRPPVPSQQVSAAAPPAPRSPPTPAEASPPASQPSSGGGLGSFFSGLFTGGAPAPTTPPSGEAGGDPQWRPRTERWVTTEKPAEKPAERRSDKTASPISTSALATGAYRLQIATVRSRKEADAVAARVRKEHANAISGRRLEVDETVFGGMGTFYRVRLGPYADVKEPRLLCDALRPKGYDCLVVTN
jgi:hypothetical protein